MNPFSRYFLIFLLTVPLSVVTAATQKDSPFEQKQIDQFVNEMVKEHSFDRTELNNILSQAEKKQTILDAISRPAEGKPWHEYRPIFMTESRIREGIKFFNENHAILTVIALSPCITLVEEHGRCGYGVVSSIELIVLELEEEVR